jgi:hypothetical protein
MVVTAMQSNISSSFCSQRPASLSLNQTFIILDVLPLCLEILERHHHYSHAILPKMSFVQGLGLSVLHQGDFS